MDSANESALSINQTLRHTDGRAFRVLWVSNEDVYWISIEPPKNTPEKVSLTTLQQQLEKGDIAYTMFPAFVKPVFKNETAALARRDRSWKAIQDIVSREPEIYDKKQRAILLKNAESVCGIKQNNLYVYLGRYWRSGKIKDALLPDYKNVGRFKDSYGDSTHRPGRKSIAGAPGGKLTHKDLAIFEEAYQKLYLTNKVRTLSGVYTEILRQYYVERDKNGNFIRDLPPDQVPSLTQFYYWHNRTKDKTDEAMQKKGPKKYNLENRGGSGSTETHLFGPCALSQIDATLADIYLVRQSDRTAIIGRPTVYFVIDAFSHIVQGFHVSLEKPSWQQAAYALLNTVEDKVTFCAKYGITIQEKDWPCRSMPSAIRGDRGEMAGYAIEEIIQSLNITIQNTPPYRGDLKGIVESMFNVCNYVYAGIPGYVEDDFGERCTDDYRLDATLDINQFIAIIIHLVLYHNNHVYMKKYKKTLDMRQHGVKPIALDIWNYGMKYRSGAQRMVNMNELRAIFLPRGEASITREGILFEGRYYTCPLAEEEHWFDKARSEGRKQISVSYDSRDSTYIYIRYGKHNEPIECALVEHMAEYGQLSEQELKELRNQDSAEEKRETYNQQRAKGKMQEDVERIIKAAENAKAAATMDKKPKAQRLKEIQINTEAEIETQRANATQRTISKLKEQLKQSHTDEGDADRDMLSVQQQQVEQKTSSIDHPDEETDLHNPLDDVFQKVYDEMEKNDNED